MKEKLSVISPPKNSIFQDNLTILFKEMGIIRGDENQGSIFNYI